MLSSNEIRSIEFEKCMRGYRPEQVQETLDKVAAQLEQLQKEKDEMEKKLYILAGKVEEYRNDEDMLKTAMINAQRLGESVIKEARQKAERILREADLKASLIDEKARERRQDEEERFISLQEKIAVFKTEVLSIYKSHIESLSDLPVDENLFPCDDKYAEITDSDFSNVIASQAETLAEPIIPSFTQEFEADEGVIETLEDEIEPEEIEIAPEEEIAPTMKHENFFAEFSSIDTESKALNAEAPEQKDVSNDSLGLNGIEYDRIDLEDDDDEQVKVFNPLSNKKNEELSQNDDDIIEILPLKKSVFDVFGDVN